MVQNHLLGDSFENGKGFLSILIPDKILETVLWRNFTKNRLFGGILAHRSRTRYGNDSNSLPFSNEIICGHF